MQELLQLKLKPASIEKDLTKQENKFGNWKYYVEYIKEFHH